MMLVAQGRCFGGSRAPPDGLNPFIARQVWASVEESSPKGRLLSEISLDSVSSDFEKNEDRDFKTRLWKEIVLGNG